MKTGIRLLAVMFLSFHLSGCGGVDTSSFSVSNIPPPPKGKSQIVVFGNHQHTLEAQVYLNRGERRDLRGSILTQFTTEPGRHEILVDVSSLGQELGPADLVLGSGESAYIAIMIRKIYERDWSQRQVEILATLINPALPDAGVVLVKMNRMQADEYWRLKKLW